MSDETISTPTHQKADDGPVVNAPPTKSWWARYSSTSPITLTALALILGVVIGAVIIMVTSAPVLNSWRHSFHHVGSIGGTLKLTFDTVAAAYRAMVTGSIIDPTLLFHAIATGHGWDQTLTPISETLTYATPLVIASIGVGIAFQTGIFNIGANGQAILGAIAGTAVASMIHLPMIAHLPLTLLGGIIGGAVCGMVPGVLKAYTGAHEVIVTLMFNYVVNAILIYALTSTALQLPGQSNDISRTFDSTATLNPLFGTKSGLRVSYGIFVAAAVVVFAIWFLKRSSLGFDFRVTGANPNAARASGINPKTIVLAVFLVSGGLSGLAGIVQAASTTHYIDGGFLVGSAGIGFTAITIALLGRLQPIGIVWGSLLFAALGVGGRAMQAATGIPLDLATIIQSVVVLFVASPVLITEIFRLRSGAQSFQLANKGWGIMTTLDTTAVVSGTPKVREPVGRRRIIGVLTIVLGLFVMLAFGMGSAAAAHSQFTFTPVNTSSGAPWHLAPLTVLTRWWNIALGLVTVGIGVETWIRRPAGALVRFGVGGVLFFIALLLWACREPGPSPVSSLNFTSVLIGSLSIAMVLIYGSLSGVLCERSGVVNIAIEGQFIGGALAGAMVDSVTNSFWLAALVGVIVGGAVGWLLALLAVRYIADQIIIGVVIVTLMSSISSYLNIQVLAPYPNLNVGNQPSNVAIPLLSKIPIIGPVLFNETMFFYAAIVLVALISFGLFRTRWGLRVRSVGEHPKAAESVGISVARVRYSTVILGGAVAGLGGVAFIAVQGQFQPGITSGLGYIALAAMIFGKWKPSGAVVASLLFGVSAYLVDALQNENVPIPTEFMTMFPYLVTIAVVAGLIGRVRPPAADGVPYKRD